MAVSHKRSPATGAWLLETVFTLGTARVSRRGFESATGADLPMKCAIARFLIFRAPFLATTGTVEVCHVVMTFSNKYERGDFILPD